MRLSSTLHDLGVHKLHKPSTHLWVSVCVCALYYSVSTVSSVSTTVCVPQTGPPPGSLYSLCSQCTHQWHNSLSHIIPNVCMVCFSELISIFFTNNQIDHILCQILCNTLLLNSYLSEFSVQYMSNLYPMVIIEKGHFLQISIIVSDWCLYCIWKSFAIVPKIMILINVWKRGMEWCCSYG